MNNQDAIQFDNFQLLVHQNELLSQRLVTRLEHKQTQLLLLLISRAGEIVSKDQMLDQVWKGRVVGEEVLSVAISNIRRALQDNARSPRYIKTIPGEGYCFIFKINKVEKLHAAQLLGTVTRPASQPPGSENPKRRILAPTLLFVALITLVIILSQQFLKRMEPEPTPKSPAVTLYEEAQELARHNTRGNWQKAVKKYEDSLAADPSFAASYTGLALAQYQILKDQPKLLFSSVNELTDLVAKASELEPLSAEPNETLAMLYFRVGWNYPAARENFELALKKAPKNAQIYSRYAQFLLAMGEFDKALEQLSLTRKLNPRYYSSPTAAWINNMQRRFDIAMLELEKLMEVRPDSMEYHISAQSILENMGKEAESFKHLLRVLELSGYDALNLDKVRQKFKQEKLAGVYRWLVFEKKEQLVIGQYAPPLSFARYAVKAGELEKALDYLEAALGQRQYQLLWINVDPKYDALRSHPRFQQVVQSMRLIPSQIPSEDGP
jgi:DNA-binding winged helix-turn-helix (wHTH) protein/Tfp pilus assembly protein PilF